VNPSEKFPTFMLWDESPDVSSPGEKATPVMTWNGDEVGWNE